MRTCTSVNSRQMLYAWICAISVLCVACLCVYDVIHATIWNEENAMKIERKRGKWTHHYQSTHVLCEHTNRIVDFYTFRYWLINAKGPLTTHIHTYGALHSLVQIRTHAREEKNQFEFSFSFFFSFDTKIFSQDWNVAAFIRSLCCCRSGVLSLLNFLLICFFWLCTSLIVLHVTKNKSKKGN